MNKPAKIELEGKTFVVIAEEDFEDMRDRAELAQARAEGGEYFSEEVVNALLDGANPVRTFRELRAIKMKELANEAGISSAYLSEIETGKKPGSAAALKAIAAILEVDMEMLVSE